MAKKKQPEGPIVLGEYETEIEFTCPVRGKVKQKVRVKKLAPVVASEDVVEQLPTKNLAVKLDSEHPGLLIQDDSLEEQPKDEDGHQVREDS